MNKDARVRVQRGSLEGEILFEGQRVVFQVNIDDGGMRVDAEFGETDSEGQPVDSWKMFRALEAWVYKNLRG